jgi:fructose-1,6-bisphosphatase II
MDEAPMLYIGERLGKGNGTPLDIAVDPLECTNSVAYGRPNAISVLAAAPRGTMLHAPDTYMNKIAVGPEAKGAIDLDASVEYNLQAVAKAKDMQVKDLMVIMLDRPRHDKLVADIRKCGARIMMIPDGDISGAIAPCMPDSDIDILLGIGAAPEGVIAASAINAFGGEMQARLVLKDDKERERAIGMGVKDPDRKMGNMDMVNTDSSIFVATGINSGPLLKGVDFTSSGAITHSIVMRQKSGTLRYMETHHRFEDEPSY